MNPLITLLHELDPFVQVAVQARHGCDELQIVIDPTGPLLCVTRLPDGRDERQVLIATSDVPAGVLTAAAAFITAAVNELPPEASGVAAAIADGGQLSALVDPFRMEARLVLTDSNGPRVLTIAAVLQH